MTKFEIPKATIYLRDKFTIQPGCSDAFLDGKKELLKQFLLLGDKGWSLIAGLGQELLLPGTKLTAASPPMMHIWQCHKWDALYDCMFLFTEASWYAALEKTIRSETQDLFVGFALGPGVQPRPRWPTPNRPDHTYLYQEMVLKKNVTPHSYMRDLNWFAARAAQEGLAWIWSGLQVTGVPSAIGLLWSGSGPERMQDALAQIAREARYQRMLNAVETMSQGYYSPIYTEQEDIQAREAHKREIDNARRVGARRPSAEA